MCRRCSPQGATLSKVDNDLVLLGGSSGGVAVCSTGPGGWRWSSVTPAGAAPADTRFHSATLLGSQLTVFGGSGLADGNELADMCWLLKGVDNSWSWGGPRSHAPYARCAAACDMPAVVLLPHQGDLAGRLTHHAFPWVQHSCAAGTHQATRMACHCPSQRAARMLRWRWTRSCLCWVVRATAAC
jgi:hypothetical protein